MSQQRLEGLPEKMEQQNAHRESAPDSAMSFQGELHPILQLHRTSGNRRVAQLIKAKRLTPEGKIIGLQRKLTVGAPDDEYEQEANRVTRQVLSMPDSVTTKSLQKDISLEEENDKDQTLKTKPLSTSIASIVQLETESVEELEDNEIPIRAKFAGTLSGSFEAEDGVETQVNQSKGSGSPLPDHVRAYMEPRFGMDFSHVRVHTGNDAKQMNRDVGARAFTHGSDIYFGEGSSANNLELTAHELTHVVQQTGSQPIQASRLKKAISSISGLPIQRLWVVQRVVLPAWIAAMGKSLAAASAVDKAAMAATVLTAATTAQQIGSAIQPGSTGVQTYQIASGWMSRKSLLNLQQIIQFRLVNGYVAQWKASHPDEWRQLTALPPATSAATPTDETQTPPPADTTETEPEPSTATEGAIDSTIMEGVKTRVESDINDLLNTNQKTAADREYIWSDSGDHTADYFGTVGAIQYSQVKGTFLRETLRLSSDARLIPDLVVPGEGEEKFAFQLRGGRLERGPSMETGMNDELAINLVGGGPTIDEAADNGYGKHTFTTEWTWDDNATHMDLGIILNWDGTPLFDVTWRGTPED